MVKDGILALSREAFLELWDKAEKENNLGMMSLLVEIAEYNLKRLSTPSQDGD